MNTISHNELRACYLDNDEAKANAKKYFGDKQPSIHETGWYHPSGANWAYKLGIVGVHDNAYTPDIKWFEVVTQFGVVKAAREIGLPTIVRPQ